MNRKHLVIGLAVLAATAVALAALLASTAERVEYALIKSSDLMLQDVNDSHVVVKFIFDIERSEVLRNASMRIRVYDSATNLLLYELRKDLPERSGDREFSVSVAFEKDRNYIVRADITAKDRVLDHQRFKLRNLDTLIPEEKDIKAVLRDVDFLVIATTNDTVTMKARFYVESMKDYNITYHVKAVQYESNVLAAEEWGSCKLKKGKTNLIEVNFEIPRDYNYLYKLEIWRNGSLLKTWSKPLHLSPSKVIPEGVKEEKVEFEAEKFVTREEYTPQPTGAAPGFELAVALAAMLLVLRGMRR